MKVCGLVRRELITSYIYFSLLVMSLISAGFRFPKDRTTYPMDRQFLLGPALLITPVLTKVSCPCMQNFLTIFNLFVCIFCIHSNGIPRGSL